MHSSRMRTARSLPYGRVSVQGGLCPEGVSVQEKSLSRGVSLGGGGGEVFVQGVSVQGVSRGSLSRKGSP